MEKNQSPKLTVLQGIEASRAVLGGYAYLDTVNNQMSDSSRKIPGWAAGGIGAASIISDAFTIYQTANALAARDPGKVKYSIAIKNDGLEFITLRYIQKSPSFVITKSFVYLQPGSTGIIEFESDGYNGEHIFLLALQSISYDPNLISSANDVNSVSIAETPFTLLTFKINNWHAWLDKVNVNEYVRTANAWPVSSQTSLTSYVFTGSRNTKEPSFILSCMPSAVRTTKGSSFSNSILISPANGRSDLPASSGISDGTPNQYASIPTHNLLLKDILINNLAGLDSEKERFGIVTALTVLSLMTSLAATGVQIAQTIKTKTKSLDPTSLPISFNILNSTDFDISLTRISVDNILNTPLTSIKSGQTGVINLSTRPSGSLRLLFTMGDNKTVSSRPVNLEVNLAVRNDIFFVNTITVDNSVIINTLDPLSHLAQNYIYRTSGIGSLGGKNITVATTPLMRDASGEINLNIFSN